MELLDRAGCSTSICGRLFSLLVGDIPSCVAYGDSSPTLSWLVERKKFPGSGAGRGLTGIGSRNSAVVISTKRDNSGLCGLQNIC